nr:GNAT family N-acetyltransferase [Sedimentibacter sp.]
MEINIDLKNGYKIKTINKNDNINQVYGLCKRCSDYYLLHDGTYPNYEDAEEIFTSLPPNNTYEDKFVAGIFSPENELAGLMEVVRNYPEPDSWIIGLMFIDPDERKNGLGRMSHDAVKNLAINSGAKMFRLGAVEENTNGVMFWSSLGYKKVKEAKRDYKKKTHNLYTMTMEL